MYGDLIPPHKHVNKIADKYIRYFLNDMKKESFTEDEYLEIRIEERYTGNKTRLWKYSPVVPIKHKYLIKFINIFKSFNCNICLCNENHEHPRSLMGGLEYEGYCYYMEDEEKKILFLEDYSYEVEDDGFDYDVIYEKISNNSASYINLLDWSNLIPKNERYSCDNQEWYRNLSIEKRYKIVDANTETEIAFEQWLKEIV